MGEPISTSNTKPAAHTPGPWYVGDEFTERVGAYRVRGFPISGSGKAIARVWNGTEHNNLPPIGNEANAQLIAAAPDLLAALQNLENWATAMATVPSLNIEPLIAARAAIAKATQP